MLKLCIFDLDGTTADTIEDLADAANYALSCKGLPLHTIEEYKYFVGNGIPKLISRACGSDDTALNNELLDLFNYYYSRHYVDKTKPYNGIINVLDSLKDMNVGVAVYSNKADEYVGVILDKLFPGIRFAWYTGKRDGYPLKPDVTLMLELLKRDGIKPHECLYIGDSNVDIQTAKNAGMVSCGVLWGFRTKQELADAGADHLADKPEDIIALVRKL